MSTNKTKSGKFLRITGIVLLAIILVAGIFLAYRFVRMKIHNSSMPTITVFQPEPDQPVIKGLSNPVQVLATASGGSVSALEWYLDGTLAGRVEGEGEKLSANWEWMPEYEGTHRFSFIAYAENGAMGLASLETVVISGADVDADGVPDELDECPSEAGPAASGGCALPGDEDADGLVGEMDACPDDAGYPEFSGCPAGLGPDRDADGTYDASDRCPDESGWPEWDGCPLSAWSINTDGDELPDFLDDCPTAYGPRDSGGCPLAVAGDADGDSVPDASDSCADSPGAPSESGCPLEDDRDGDGLADAIDGCPDEAGPAASGGCHAEDGTADRDMDGVPDSVDLCVDEPGLLAYSGCPMPDDRDGDGVPDGDDRCADLPGSPGYAGCPIVAFPEVEYAAQFQLFPIIADLRARDLIALIPGEGDTDGHGGGGHSAMCDDFDGDGVLDDDDRCYEDAGRPSNEGCPLDGDQDSDAVPDDRDACIDVAGPTPSGCPNGDEQVRLNLSIENFQKDPGWSGVYCYIGSNGIGSGFVRLPKWKYEYTMPSISVVYDTRENLALSVDIHCWGQPFDRGLHSQYLGSIQTDLDFFFWDHQTRKARGCGPDGWFEIWYSIWRVSYYVN